MHNVYWSIVRKYLPGWRRVLPLVFSLLVAELLLQVASGLNLTVRRLLAPPWQVVAPSISDPRLLSRGNPLSPDHDTAGYRNPARLSSAEIVVLGDSQAYGLGVAANMAWPRVLERETRQRVYNMAFPGYGPGQSLFQLDEALSLAPRVLVVAPYFGNDFYDAYVLAKHHPELAESSPVELRAAAAALDRQRPIEATVEPLFAPDRIEAAPAPSSAGRRLVSEHLKVYGLVRALRYRFTQLPSSSSPLLYGPFSEAVKAMSPELQKLAVPFDSQKWRTILTAPYRARVLDDRDPRIRLGFDIARYCLRAIADRCRQAGVSLLVVLIPTKESVFWPLVRDPDRYAELRQLVADEDRLRREWIVDLQDRGVRYVDLLDALRASPSQPYFEGVDGHPNEHGHQVTAAAVAESVNAAGRAGTKADGPITPQ